MMIFPVSRRRFLHTAALAAGGLTTVTRFANARALGANDRIRFGVIGCGGMGTGHLNELVKRSTDDNLQVVAVCDVYRRRLNRAKSTSGGEGYLDYRKLLDRDDIDAVLIATPDHWHSKIAIDAMASGKHVYVEKPMTHTVEQAIELRDAVARYGKVLEVGPQATGNDGVWLDAHEAIRAGRIGKVTWAQGSYNRNARVCLFNEHQKIDPTAGPDKTGDDFVDWDMWLGHEWGSRAENSLESRTLLPISQILALQRRRGHGPAVSQAGAAAVGHRRAGRRVPAARQRHRRPIHRKRRPRHSRHVLAHGRLPERVFDLSGQHAHERHATGGPHLWQARDHGFRRHAGAARKQRICRRIQDANGGLTEVKLEPKPRRDMKGNFVDCIRGRGALNCNVKLGAATMVAIKLAVESYRQSKMIAGTPPANA